MIPTPGSKLAQAVAEERLARAQIAVAELVKALSSGAPGAIPPRAALTATMRAVSVVGEYLLACQLRDPALFEKCAAFISACRKPHPSAIMLDRIAAYPGKAGVWDSQFTPLHRHILNSCVRGLQMAQYYLSQGHRHIAIMQGVAVLNGLIDYTTRCGLSPVIDRLARVEVAHTQDSYADLMPDINLDQIGAFLRQERKRKDCVDESE